MELVLNTVSCKSGLHPVFGQCVSAIDPRYIERSFVKEKKKVRKKGRKKTKAKFAPGFSGNI